MFEIREVFLPEFRSSTRGITLCRLESAQLDSADLAGNGFRQFPELDAADALVRPHSLTNELQDVPRDLRRRMHGRLQNDKCLRDCPTPLIHTRDDSRLGY